MAGATSTTKSTTFPTPLTLPIPTTSPTHRISECSLTEAVTFTAAPRRPILITAPIMPPESAMRLAGFSTSTTGIRFRHFSALSSAPPVFRPTVAAVTSGILLSAAVVVWISPSSRGSPSGWRRWTTSTPTTITDSRLPTRRNGIASAWRRASCLTSGSYCETPLSCSITATPSPVEVLAGEPDQTHCNRHRLQRQTPRGLQMDLNWRKTVQCRHRGN